MNAGGIPKASEEVLGFLFYKISETENKSEISIINSDRYSSIVILQE